jgi:hypothetical protein
MLFVSAAALWRKKDPEVVSSDESPDNPCDQKNEQEKITLVGVDKRLAGGSARFLREFLDHRFVDAGPGGGSTGQVRRSGEEQSGDRQN